MAPDLIYQGCDAIRLLQKAKGALSLELAGNIAGAIAGREKDANFRIDLSQSPVCFFPIYAGHGEIK